jgi:hypothetical protein
VLKFFAQQFSIGETLGVGHEAGAHGTDSLIFAVTAPFFDGELAVALNQLPFFFDNEVGHSAIIVSFPGEWRRSRATDMWGDSFTLQAGDGGIYTFN